LSSAANLAKPQSPAKPQNPSRVQSQPRPQAAEQAPERTHNPAPKLAEPTVPLFVSMGKRQRLRPQELRDLITEKTGILNDELGRVHLFDNYSFIDIQVSQAEKVVSACDGSPFKGRSIEIKPAKKKAEPGSEKDPIE
jgi:ATP-dependent RNA helicase DeaD